MSLELPVQTHLLQTLDSVSGNWICHFEFKITSDTLAPAESNMIKVFGTEGTMVEINVAGDYTLNVDGVLFQPKKDVYHKVQLTLSNSTFYYSIRSRFRSNLKSPPNRSSHKRSSIIR